MLCQSENAYLFSTIVKAPFVADLALGIPVVIDLWVTGLVPRLPTAVLASGLIVPAFLSLMSGVLLDSGARARCEFKRLA